MKYVATILLLVTVAFGSTFAAPTASAQPFPRAGAGQEMQSLNTILANIRRQFPGQLSDVQGPVNGRYLIKWLTPEGQILFIDTDARTGQVLGVRGGADFRRQNFAPTPAFRADPAPSRPDRFRRWPPENLPLSRRDRQGR